MKNFSLLATDMPVAGLLERLQNETALWEEDTRRSRFPNSPHAQAQQIILRWAADQSIEAAFRDLDCIDYPAIAELMPAVGRTYTACLSAVADAGHPGRAMLTKLPPGGQITLHTDEGLYADYYDRFHVCIDADENSTFTCGAEEVEMRPGECWWFNHKRAHSVFNGGQRDRLHMIVDVQSPRHRALRGLTYQPELVSDLWDEFWPLLEAHYREIAAYKDIELDPDRAAYAQLEIQDELACYTARSGGTLIGYLVFFVRRNTHYQGSLQAWQDVMFIHKDHRGRAGIELIRYAERALAAQGVQVVYHHAKTTNNFPRLLKAMGYTLVDEIYAKRLDTRS